MAAEVARAGPTRQVGHGVLERWAGALEFVVGPQEEASPEGGKNDRKSKERGEEAPHTDQGAWLNTNEALVPPKPNEFDSTLRTGRS